MQTRHLTAAVGLALVAFMQSGCSIDESEGAQISAPPSNVATAQPTKDATTPLLEPTEEEVAAEPETAPGSAVEVGPMYNWPSGRQMPTPSYLDEYQLLTFDRVSEYGISCMNGQPFNEGNTLGDVTYDYFYLTEAGTTNLAAEGDTYCHWIPIDSMAPGYLVQMNLGYFASNEAARAFMYPSSSSELIDGTDGYCVPPVMGSASVCEVVIGQFGIQALMATSEDPAVAVQERQYLGKMMMAFADAHDFGADN
jgi:hypothetical protein